MVFEKINGSHHGIGYCKTLSGTAIRINQHYYQHGGTFIDCTFGQGGYTKKILSHKNTQVIALDRDIKSKKKANKILEEFQDRFIFKNKKFSQLDNLIN